MIYLRSKIVVGALSLVVGTQLTAGTQNRSDEAEISGIVTTLGVTPTPIGKALVMISGQNLKQSRVAVTGSDGSFVFRNLLPGTYLILAERPPYVKTAFGALRPGRAGTPLVVGLGERVSDVTIQLARGAAVTGLLRNVDGEPAVNVPIELMSPVDDDHPVAQAITDDRGVYRLFGLAPGRYRIRATPRAGEKTAIQRWSDAQIEDLLSRLQQGGFVSAAQLGRVGQPASVSEELPTYSLPPIYYPGTANPDDAELLTLATAEERAGVDFDVRLVRTAVLEGLLSSRDGNLPSVQVVLTRLNARPPAEGVLRGGVSAPVNSTGSFRLSGVLPGKYRLTARALLSSAQSTRVLWALADLTVADESVQRVSLTLQEGLRLTGRVVFEGHGPKSTTPVQLRLLDVSGSFQVSSFSVPHNDGTFEIAGIVPGTYGIASAVPNATWWLRSVSVAGRDVLDVPFEIGPNGDMSGAMAIFTDQHTELSGTLQSLGKVPVRNYFLVVVPSDRTLWWPGSRRIRSMRPAANGSYAFRDLPPGNYFIAAVTDMEPADLADPAYIEALLPAALPVRLQLGERTIQDLRLAR